MNYQSVEELGPEYNLLWPPEIFRDEVYDICQVANMSPERRGYPLLREAFEDEAVARDLEQLSNVYRVMSQQPSMTEHQFLMFLADHAEELHNRSIATPYWLERSGIEIANEKIVKTTLREDFVGLVDELIQLGYFDRRAPRPCESVYGDDEPTTEEQLNKIVSRVLKTANLWLNLQNEDLRNDYIYAVIEVFHDLVSRPIDWILDEQNDCGLHFTKFSKTTGQRVYRWKIDELLKLHGVDLKFAVSGENVGRLIRTFDDPLEQLRDVVVDHTEEVNQGTVEHAISLFEKRGATREEKRSACVNLAGILEQRRRLINQQLVSADEKLLFEMANKFDLRHRNPRQNSNYSEEFLDWIFWIYLATVQLTNNFIEAQDSVEVSGQE